MSEQTYTADQTLNIAITASNVVRLVSMVEHPREQGVFLDPPLVTGVGRSDEEGPWVDLAYRDFDTALAATRALMDGGYDYRARSGALEDDHRYTLRVWG